MRPIKLFKTEDLLRAHYGSLDLVPEPEREGASR